MLRKKRSSHKAVESVLRPGRESLVGEICERGRYPTPKNLAGKTLNFAELQPTRRQLETAQHINKQIPDVSSTM